MNLLPDVSGDVSKFNSEEKIGSIFLPGKFCEVATLETCNCCENERECLKSQV